MRKLKTIKLSGKEYAQVAERLRAIHEDHKGAFDILTEYNVTESGNIVFTAKIALYLKEGVRTYSGHSFGKVGATKAFEKLETIAVGRALAFAGYHGDGEIASTDEMQELAKDLDTEAVTSAIAQIQSAKTVPAMRKAYKDMPVEIQQNKDVIEAGKAKKKELTTINV